MLTIANSQLQLALTTQGAELKSLLFQGVEFLWNKKEFWAKTSPTLFPFIGGFKGKRYFYHGKEYPFTSKHGFARDTNFTLVEQKADSITLMIESNEQSLLNYPFVFAFYITYTLEENKLVITYRVKNKGDSTMLFSLGAHPAFILEDDYEQHAYLEFEQEEDAPKYSLTPEGLIAGQEPFFTLLPDAKVMELKEEYFTNDAIIFSNLNSQVITLRASNSNKAVQCNFQDFPEIAFWKVPQAPFLCIEPWHGLTDSVSQSEELEQRAGILTLEAGKDFTCQLEFSFYL